MEDLKKIEKAARRRRLGYGKRILGQALKGFYYFDDDEVENFIDKMDLQFAGHPRARHMIASSVLGHDKIREKVCDAAAYVFGDVSCK